MGNLARSRRLKTQNCLFKSSNEVMWESFIIIPFFIIIFYFEFADFSFEMNKLSWKRLWIRLHVPCPAFSLFRSYHPLVTDTVFNPSNGPQSESKLKIERQNPKIRWQILFEQDRTKTFVFKDINYLPKRVFANESFLRTRVFEQFITSINQSRIFKSLVLLFWSVF